MVLPCSASLLSAADILQYIEPVHDLFHVRVIGQAGDDVDGLFLQGFQSDLDVFKEGIVSFLTAGGRFVYMHEQAYLVSCPIGVSPKRDYLDLTLLAAVRKERSCLPWSGRAATTRPLRACCASVSDHSVTGLRNSAEETGMTNVVSHDENCQLVRLLVARVL